MLLPADVAFGEFRAVSLPPGPMQLFLLGQAVAAEISVEPGSTVRAYDLAQRFLGLAEVKADGRLQPVRLFVDTQGASV